MTWTPRCVVGKYKHNKREQTYIYKTNSLAELNVKDWNYHTGGQKNHYGGSTWIVNKALEMQNYSLEEDINYSVKDLIEIESLNNLKNQIPTFFKESRTLLRIK